MHSFIALPGDVIVRAGQPGREMYVLSRGTVRAVTAVDLYVLDRAMYDRVATAYPDVAAALAEAARQRVGG